MRQSLTFPIALVALGLAAPAAPAHFAMLLPSSASAKRGEAVTFTYQWGHPFEHQLFDAPAPRSVVVVTPDGKQADLTKSLEKITVPGADDKKVTAYRFTFKPEQRGDHVFVLQTPPVWMEEEQHFVQDAVKVVLHVQSQKGWDNSPDGQAFDFRPLTRPYGLLPGMVFQAAVLDPTEQAFEPAHRFTRWGSPYANLLVEVERYNPAPPKELPADEHVTRTAKTDPNGVVTATLTEPGWWCLTAPYPRGGEKREELHKGKPYPVRQRLTLWVFVDEKPGKADK